ncbi:MAG: WGR domain-containing protein, partial [Azoarcus sp.]|nr:WGR domain-containing protein [Azoarcus sp.]
MRRFEFDDGKSRKFWEIEQVGTDLNICWGRIGTAGQRQTKCFDDAAKAATALGKLVKEKTGKGYAEAGVDAAATIGNTPAKPTPAPISEPAAEAAPESLDSQVERVVAAVRQAIAAGGIKAGDSVTEAQLKRQYQVSERGAKLAHDRLRDSGIFRWYGNEIAKEAQAIAAHAESSVTATPTVAPEATAVDPDAPPWLSAGTPIRLNGQMRRVAYASRRFPQAVPESRNVNTAWHKVYQLWAGTSEDHRLDKNLVVGQSDAVFRPALERLKARLTPETPSPDPEVDTLLFALMLENNESQSAAVVHYLVAQYGLPGVLDIYLGVAKMQVTWAGNRRGGRVVSATVQRPLSHHPMTEGEETLRQYLAAAPEAEWQACADTLEAALPQLEACRRTGVALLLPDRPEISNRLAFELKGEDSAHWLLSTATDAQALALLYKARVDYWTFWSSAAMTATLLQERGLEAIAVLERGAGNDEAGEALAAIGTPEAITALAKVASTSKAALARTALAAERWPLAAIVALSRLIAGEGKEAGLMTPMLLRLLRGHASQVDALRPWLTAAAQGVIDRLLQRLSGPGEIAETAELPPVLAAPPWRAAQKKKSIAALAVVSLPLPVTENWPEGARENALSIDNQWQRKSYDAAQKSVAELVHILFPGGNKDYLPQKEAAIAAIQAGEESGGGVLQRLGGIFGVGAKAENQANADAFIAAWRAAIGLWKNAHSYDVSIPGLYVPLLPPAVAVSFWNAVAGEQSEARDLDHLMARLGVAALPGLIAEMRRHPAQTWGAALNYGAVELAEPMARAFAKTKSLREAGRAWLLKYPEHAACGLIAPAVGKAGEARDCAAMALRMLAAEGHGKLLGEAAARYENPEVAAALDAVLNEDPLDLYPAKRQKLPEFWQPANWPRPVLENGKALPDGALDALGEMLTFPTVEGVYAGIGQVKAACTPASLAAFAWECFNAWLEAGAPGKDNWTLAALGFFGDDDIARKLTPLIRTWPGEAAHARAVTGLGVLESIGTDVALMLLNGIAQKLKFKGLQDKAREKIEAIAEKRGFTPEELEDRLAPDLGLDARGALILDFGPRRFTVGFDEALKPYVREMDGDRAGARLADLPKPKKTDDAELSGAAVERFKLLKKD